MRFHLDEHIDASVARALGRRGIDVTTSEEAGLLGASDRAQIEHAQTEMRVIVTADSDFLKLSSAGVEHHGIVFCRASHSVGRIIEFLVLIDACLESSDMHNHVEFL